MTESNHVRTGSGSGPGGEAARPSAFPWGVVGLLGFSLAVTCALGVLLGEQEARDVWQLGSSGAAAVVALALLEFSLGRLMPRSSGRSDPEAGEGVPR